MSTIWGLKAALALGATLLLGHAAVSLLSPPPRRRRPQSVAGVRKTQGLIGLIAACLFGLAMVTYDGLHGPSAPEADRPVSIDAHE